MLPGRSTPTKMSRRILSRIDKDRSTPFRWWLRPSDNRDLPAYPLRRGQDTNRRDGLTNESVGELAAQTLRRGQDSPSPTGRVKSRLFAPGDTSVLRCGARNLIHEIHVSSSLAPELPRLLNLRQAAQLLSVSRRTLEREIAAGNFPRPLKIGRSTRVAETDLRAYISKLQGAALNPSAS